MLKNILPVSQNPRYEIFDYPFLSPTPLLAALTALQTILNRGHGTTTEKRVGSNNRFAFFVKGSIILPLIFRMKIYH